VLRPGDVQHLHTGRAFGDRQPQRDADRGGVSQPDTGRGGKHVGRHPGRQSVRHSGPRIRLMDDDRQATLACGKIGGHGHVAPKAHHDLGPHAVEHGSGRPDGVAHPARRLQQVAAQLARQWHWRDKFGRVAAGRDERGV
jgi:hypothetical protein